MNGATGPAIQSSSTASTARARWCRHSASPAIPTTYRRSRPARSGASTAPHGAGSWITPTCPSDDIVVVTAASSSAALGGLQIAKIAGAVVIAATRRSDKADFLRGAGADHVIATEEEDFASRVMEITGGQGFTIAYDPVGGTFIGDLVAAAQPYGTIVNYGNLRTEPIDIPVLPMLAKRLFFKFPQPLRHDASAREAGRLLRLRARSRGQRRAEGDRRPDLPPGGDRGRAPLHGIQRAAGEGRRHDLRPASAPTGSGSGRAWCGRTGGC